MIHVDRRQHSLTVLVVSIFCPLRPLRKPWFPNVRIQFVPEGTKNLTYLFTGLIKYIKKAHIIKSAFGTVQYSAAPEKE